MSALTSLGKGMADGWCCRKATCFWFPLRSEGPVKKANENKQTGARVISALGQSNVLVGVREVFCDPESDAVHPVVRSTSVVEQPVLVAMAQGWVCFELSQITGFVIIFCHESSNLTILVCMTQWKKIRNLVEAFVIKRNHAVMPFLLDLRSNKTILRWTDWRN